MRTARRTSEQVLLLKCDQDTSKLTRMLAAGEKCHETEESEMTTPGFTAEASVYASQNRYLTILDRSAGIGIEQPGSIGRLVYLYGP
jgi:hypothetical protein